MLRPIIRQFFEEENWNILPLPDEAGWGGYFIGDNGKWSYAAIVMEADERFGFYSILAENTPEPQRRELCDAITRINYGLVIGNFEMDLDDGELRFKTSLDAQGEAPSLTLVQHVIYSNVATVDKYLPLLTGVAAGNVSSAEVVATLKKIRA